MPTLVVDNFNIVCACLGGFITIFGLVSYLLKEKFYLSEACMSADYVPISFATDGTSDIPRRRCHLLSQCRQFSKA